MLTQPSTTGTVLDRYSAAWDSHDVDAIMALQGDDMQFELCASGYSAATGPEQVRSLFAYFLDAWKDLTFTPVRQHLSGDLFVSEYRFSGELVQSLPLDGSIIEPTGRSVDVAGTDIITGRDGLVRSKRTYLDTLAVHAQLTGAPAAG